MIQNILLSDLLYEMSAMNLENVANQSLLIYKDQFIVLYNPNILIQKISELDTNKKKGFYHYLSEYAKDIIISIIKLDKLSNNLYQISKAGALKGYGPLTYEIAMSIIYPNYLTSDRNWVSDKALNVWKKFYVRENEFDKQKIKETNLMYDKGNYEDPDYEDSRDYFLNYKYKIKNKIDFSDLVLNHSKTIEILNKNNDFLKEININSGIIQLGLTFFDIM